MVITTFLLFLFLCAQPAIAQTAPWILGDENTVACFTVPSYGDATTPSLVSIAGIDFGFVNPLPATLTSNVPINSTVRLNLQNNFYTSNNGVFLPDPASVEFSQLCLRHVNPQNPTQAACIPPISNATCCVPHLNWHFCSMTFMNRSECLPWIPPQNSSSGSILVTGSPSLYGFPGQTWESGDFSLSQPDQYMILAHFKMGNIQCGVGALRTVVAAPIGVTVMPIATVKPSVAAVSEGTGSPLSTAVIAGIVVGGTGVLAVAALVFAIIVRNRNKNINTNNYHLQETDSASYLPPTIDPNLSGNSPVVSPTVNLASTGLKPDRSPIPHTPTLKSNSPNAISTTSAPHNNQSTLYHPPQPNATTPYPSDNPFAYPQQQQFFMPYPAEGGADVYQTQQLYTPAYYPQKMMPHTQRPQQPPLPPPISTIRNVGGAWQNVVSTGDSDNVSPRNNNASSSSPRNDDPNADKPHA